jgi:hypothetical protein
MSQVDEQQTRQQEKQECRNGVISLSLPPNARVPQFFADKCGLFKREPEGW